MLHVLGTVHDLIEPPELLGGQDTWQTTSLLLGSQFTDLPDPLVDIPPGLIVQPLLRTSGRSGRRVETCLISPFRFVSAIWAGFRACRSPVANPRGKIAVILVDILATSNV